ncbi:hypothetical protein Lal_00011322 [Lupinus albus]|nr:hypothetical protein Lal_00011322 [Lupinus albus]
MILCLHNITPNSQVSSLPLPDCHLLYCIMAGDSRLSEGFSPGRERLTWEGEILGYTEGFSAERGLAQLSESGLAWARKAQLRG